jgi:hypothetical protein
MTNREVLNTLNNRELGILMRSLLFRPSDWVKGAYAQQHSTPSELKIETWLNEPADDYKNVWDYVHAVNSEWESYKQNHPESYAEMAANN